MHMYWTFAMAAMAPHVLRPWTIYHYQILKRSAAEFLRWIVPNMDVSCRKSNGRKYFKKRNRPEDTLDETYNLPLKTDGWKTTLLLRWRILRGKLLVSRNATVLNVCFELPVCLQAISQNAPNGNCNMYLFNNLLHRLLSHSCRWNLPVSMEHTWQFFVALLGWLSDLLELFKWPPTRIKLCHGLNRL